MSLCVKCFLFSPYILQEWESNRIENLIKWWGLEEGGKLRS